MRLGRMDVQQGPNEKTATRSVETPRALKPRVDVRSRRARRRSWRANAPKGRRDSAHRFYPESDAASGMQLSVSGTSSKEANSKGPLFIGGRRPLFLGFPQRTAQAVPAARPPDARDAQDHRPESLRS